MQHLVTPPENMLGTAKQKAILHDLKTQEKKTLLKKLRLLLPFSYNLGENVQ